MDTFEVRNQDGRLIVSLLGANEMKKDVLSVPVQSLELGEKHETEILLTDGSQKYKIFYMEEQECNGTDTVVAVWSDHKRILYAYMELAEFYKELVRFFHRVVHTSLSGRTLSMNLIGYFQNSYGLTLTDQRFYIDELNQCPAHIKEYKRRQSIKSLALGRNLYHFSLPLKNLLTDETKINNMLNVVMMINGTRVEFRIGKRFLFENNTRLYFAPYKSTYYKEFAIHLRRTNKGNIAIVKRLKEPIEKTSYFRVMESKPVSCALYNIGRLTSKLSKKKVHLFYEKFSEKAEEGTFDLFLLTKKHKGSRSYYIIDETSKDYERICNESNVVRKYSLKYYWLLYRSNDYISTEAPAHLNIIRSNNKYFRKTTCKHDFIFLQHGVTYMKCQGPSSTFVVGKEGEPSYMVVGSEKERDVVSDMLGLPKERVLITGLPIFSGIPYKHITEESEDRVVIMLTWKSYEEQLLNFEYSDYYKNVIAIYDILKQYIDESKIIIVAHPKVEHLLERTDLKDAMWKRPISEVLGLAKLLITDYSSVCYNSFYQGGGVVFFQPDLELYEKESGPLIPAQDEYIGERVFDLEALNRVVGSMIENGKINLAKARTKVQEERYASINEFHDGKNIERIYQALEEQQVL